MKKFIFALLTYFVFSSVVYSQSISYLPFPLFRSYNFECAGFVTAVFPGSNSSGNLTNQILYAKTDIGGIYRSSNNGLNWILISNYHSPRDNRGTAFSEYITAGLAVHPTDPNKLVVAWGDFENDASSINFKCVNYSIDGGNNWKECGIPAPGVWFQGDNTERKMGGECVVFDKRSGYSNYVYTGGISPSGNQPHLYMSSNSGANFTDLSSSQYNIFTATAGDTITCIATSNSRNEMFVGTTSGVYISTGYLGGYPIQFTKLTIPTSIGGKNIRRILIRSDGNVFFVFGAYGNFYVAGGGIAKYYIPTNTWTDLSTSFEYDNGGTLNTTHGNYMSLLSFGNDENTLIAGRVNRPIRISTNSGANWNGDVGSGINQVHFIYEPINSNLPNHQASYELTDGFMYGGLCFIAQNKNSGCTNTWYVSGGAGLRISDNSNPSSGLFNGKKWHYSTQGQSMPVVYDVVFEGANPYDHIFFPMSDWTMGWNYHTPWNSGALQFDDNITHVMGTNGYITWISNASRDLISLHNTSQSYLIGGDLYSGLNRAKMGSRVSGSTVTITPLSSEAPTHDPLFDQNDRFICDGLIFDQYANADIFNDPDFNIGNLVVSNQDQMIILVGSEQESYPSWGPYLGVYYTTDQGHTFSPGSFDIPSDNSSVSTYDLYQNSLLPGYNGAIQGMFDAQFNLANGYGNYKYLYLKNGGVFKTTNRGQNWQSLSSPLSGYGGGCLKYISTGTNTGALIIAIQGLGVRKGIINSSGDVTSWTSIGNFTDASQVDVLSKYDINYNSYYQEWAVFGKRSGDTYSKLYKSIFSDNYWKLISNKIRGVRSLRINPYKREELFIATTGLGVISYENMTNGEYGGFVTDNIIINQNTNFDDDIIIENMGNLTIQGNINVNFAQGKKIKVLEGGKLNINGVTFNCFDSAQQWGGIEIENCDSSCAIQNCTFNNASLPIKIVNGEAYAYNEKIIKNNIFNCQNNQDFVIYAENVFSMLVQDNQFNMLGGSQNTVGLEVKNSYVVTNENGTNYSCIIDIINNTFTNGCASLILNGYASELTPFYIYGNTFTGNSVHYNIIGRLMTGVIKNNNFTGTNTENPIYFQQSNPKMFKNTISGSGTTMILNGHSYPFLSPTRNTTNTYWYGGQNNLISTSAGNINIIDAGGPFINLGYNKFSKNSSQDYFHITGMLDSVVIRYSANSNGWCNGSGIPVNYLYTSGSASILTDYVASYTCNDLPTITYNDIQLFDMGFGIIDTLFISSNGTGVSLDEDELLYNQADNYIATGQYLDAINSLKYLIDNYTTSSYLTYSLSNIYEYYTFLDTSSNETYRDNLYSDLKTYLNNKIQSKNYDAEFIDVAYNFIAMCEVNMGNYNDALTNYEFITMFHPDATIRLLASWDYAEVCDLIGYSGAEKEINAEQFREKILTKLNKVIKKDSTMGIVSEIYKRMNNEIDNSYIANSISNISTKDSKNQKDKETNKTKSNKNIISSSVSKDKRNNIIQRAENNLRVLKSMNPNMKIKKQKEDILLIAGLYSTKNKNNDNLKIPLRYNLSQNYPNPFNPITKINYEIPKESKVKLVIYDILGREIKTLVNEIKQAGKYTVEFNGGQLASGVYFYRIQIEGGKDYTAVKKMVLIK